MVTYPRDPPAKTVKALSDGGDKEVDLYLGAEWQTPLARVLKVHLPYAALLRTLAEASSFLTSFPMNVDGTVGSARIAIFSAVQSGKKLDIEAATTAVEAVINDKCMA